MYEKIQEYLARGNYPFHMPGHKRNPKFLPPGLLALDVTEIPSMDVLSSPTGIIKELQEKIANFYGAQQSFLLVNGSSAGVMAAICATCANGGSLVVPRNTHVSVYRGMVLAGAVPHYIMPQVTAQGLAGGVSPESLAYMPHGATVIVVSPTYEGVVSDIAAIAQVVHARGGILIVDEAHGAHFAFNSAFPKHALACGADIVVQSLHKTLPVPSQVAVLHVGTSRVNIQQLAFYANTLQTTSPSYMLMAACDYSLGLLWQDLGHFDIYTQQLLKLRASLPHSKQRVSLRLITSGMPGQDAVFDTDRGKILLEVNTQVDISRLLAQNYNIEVEMSTPRHILAMTSVADTVQGFNRLKEAVQDIAARLPFDAEIEAQHYSNKHAAIALPHVAIAPRQAVTMKTKKVPWHSAGGKICGQLVTQYPPGITLLAPGEVISSGLPQLYDMIEIIEE